ncbi:MAG TPA: ABC transporter permease [Proteiniclasticum sp.]|uniref:Xylose transport system permease protein XylH n=1 Tax=Proteiniclasticum ruminis TaxID=398199 RepID=A0A1I5DGP9_9CLOT|nr:MULTISPECIES: sugar ABC transporter permease [Proteiniclasticum]SFN98425.1 putative multiple sugar transport system permease protein [Proteiniclasticum ruminis]HBW12760.1 ABC transporter permease [Proteiniclasticum sp.]
MELLNDLKTMLKKNIREYGMFIALFAIMLVFSILSDGVFMSPRNISNLINSMGYIAVLAVGMTLILIIKHIDLSVGYVAGFLGAVAAMLMTSWDLPVLLVIPIILFLGILIGLFNGFMVAKLQLPAFVVSLAGMLIFRGALLQVTAKTGTIIIPNKTFNNIGVGYIPDPVKLLPGFHTLTLVIGALFIVFFILAQFKNRKNKLKYQFEVVPIKIFYIKLVFVSALIAYVTYILSDYNGLSWTVVIVLIVVALYHFLTTKTVLGRHIYAVGGNDEAAKLSGIDVKKVTLFVFSSMSMLAALSGILYTARLQSATVTAGTGFELDAIASAYVGGVSAAGGVGKVTGSIIGALVMASLTSGMNLLNVGASYQYIIRGAILILAVVFDVQTRNKAK